MGSPEAAAIAHFASGTPLRHPARPNAGVAVAELEGAARGEGEIREAQQLVPASQAPRRGRRSKNVWDRKTSRNVQSQ